jgi:uncharacterized membrane protein YoaK (UPF0700 family)
VSADRCLGKSQSFEAPFCCDNKEQFEYVPRAVPVLLSFVAGYVDSCTFLALGGLFVAGLTGSFVAARAQFAAHDDKFLNKVLAIPDFFAAGVLTTMIVTWMGERRRWALATTLGLVAVLLTGLLAIGLSPQLSTIRDRPAA